MAKSVGEYRITRHAAFEMKRRGIGEKIVEHVFTAPEQRYAVRPGRDVLQSKIAFAGTTYLVRVLVDVDRRPVEVVTVYRTSNIAKYWRSKT